MISERVRKMMEEGAGYPLAEHSEKEERDITKMCSNENPFGPSPKALKAVEQEAKNIGEYPDSNPIELKEAISDYLGVNSTQLCVGNGSDEIMDLICKAFMDPGDKVLIPIPTFSWYELICRINSMIPIFMRLEEFEWDSDRLVEGLEDAKAVFIGRPNNPTGNSIDKEDLEKVLDTGKIIIVDEAYVEFSEGSIANWVNDYENLVVLRTFSKMFGLAGLRVGYGIAGTEPIMALEKVRPPFSVNRLAQKAAIAALEDKEFLNNSRKKILEGRETLFNELKDMGFEVLPSEANFLMIDPTPLGMTASEICNRLYEKGIVIRNLSGFRGIEDEWVRITVGKPEQNKHLIEALKEIKEEIK